MPAIPPTGDFPKATIDKDTFHAKFLAVHAYLTGLLGSDGVAATARAQLGLVLGSASGQIPTNGTKTATESLAGLVELATQAKAEAGTLDDVVMTPLKTAQAIAALTVPLQYKSSILASGSDTWTVPDGVTSAFVVVVGGGGGGSAYSTFGRAGGAGGVAAGFVTLVPGATHTRTVGAGGAGGSGASSGGAGSTSSFGSLLTATGGAGGVYNSTVGAVGVGSGGTTLNSNVGNHGAPMFGGDSSNGASSTSPITWASTITQSPGAVGQGGDASLTYGRGAVGGVVAIFYVGP